MYDDLINAVCAAVNNDEGGSWEDKARAIYAAFEKSDCLSELEEFHAWFEENEMGEFLPA